jgi:predicted nuclease of predicted toxin-antitoxin system
MKFLANENFPFPSIKIIRAAGYEVRSISEESPGLSDEMVLDIAVNESLIILTFDSDYGELLFKYKKDPPPAVVYFRSKGNNPEYTGKIFLGQLQSGTLALEGFFTVIEETGIRQRVL